MQLKNHNTLTVIKDIPRSELNLDKTLDSGQTFRWSKSLKDNTWYGTIGKELVTLKQTEDTIITNVPYDQKDKIIQYLNLDMSYTEEMSKLDLESDDYLRRAYEAGKGVHILRQDPFEMMITFIISQMNSMNNIRNSVKKLSETFGEEVSTVSESGEKLTSYTFPTPEDLGSASSSALRACKVGFRDQYIKEASKFISKSPKFLDELNRADYNTAMKMLKSFNGIGDKVANCVCLFALHHINAFPVDTHIKQIINKEYNGVLDIKKYGSIAGIVQQYMFYYKALCKES